MGKADEIIQMLQQRGCREVPSKSSSYRKFTRPDDDGFYFVGKAGALRAGKSASDSVSLTHAILKKGEIEMKKKSKVLKGVNAFPIAEEKQTEQTSTIEQPIPQSSTTVPQQEEPQTEPISGSSTQPSPDVPKPKKLSSSDFVMYHLCANPEATEDEIKEALNQAGLKMSESVLKTWRPFMGKIFNKLAELGWQRPQTN